MKDRVYFDLGIGLNLSGRVVIELFGDAPPKVAENFKKLCAGSSEYILKGRSRVLSYRSCAVFRVIKGEYLQLGDVIRNDGTGFSDDFLVQDFVPKRQHSQAGLLTLMNSKYLSQNNEGRNMFCSQFAILLGKMHSFDGRNAVVGRVVSGMEFVRAIENVPVNSNYSPQISISVIASGLLSPADSEFSDHAVYTGDKAGVGQQKKLLDSLMSTLEQEEPEESDEEPELSRCVYSGRLDRKRKADSKSANFIGKKLLTESLNGIEHHYIPRQSPESAQAPTKTEPQEKQEHLLPEIAELPREAPAEDSDSELQDPEDEITARLLNIKDKLRECSTLNKNEIIHPLRKPSTNQQAYAPDATTKLSEPDVSAPEPEGLPVTLTKELNTSAYAVDRQNKIERTKSKNKSFGWNVFNQDSLYRAHKKRLKETGFNYKLYEEQKNALGDSFYNPTIVNHNPSEASKDVVVRNLEKQNKKRELFSRRRMFDDEVQDISYINERNRVFNKKLDRSFGAYSKEIKDNLERGTAL